MTAKFNTHKLSANLEQKNTNRGFRGGQRVHFPLKKWLYSIGSIGSSRKRTFLTVWPLPIISVSGTWHTEFKAQSYEAIIRKDEVVNCNAGSTANLSCLSHSVIPENRLILKLPGSSQSSPLTKEKWQKQNATKINRKTEQEKLSFIQWALELMYRYSSDIKKDTRKRTQLQDHCLLGFAY